MKRAAACADSPAKKLLTITPFDLLGEAPPPTPLSQVCAQLETRGHAVFEWSVLRKDGERIPVEVVVYRLILKGRRCLFSAVRDLSGRRQAEQQLRDANRRLAEIIDCLPDPTYVIDRQRRVIAWNRALEVLTGVPKQQAHGQQGCYAQAIYGSDEPGLIDIVDRDEATTPVRFSKVRREGHTIHAETYSPVIGNDGAHLAVTATALVGADGRLVGAIECVRDITAQKHMEQTLERWALFDAPTGLHTRACLEDRLDACAAAGTSAVGLIVCDVDGLKLVNDSLGHQAGDAVLRAAAGLIKGCFRDNDLVARIGGDEFAVLIDNTSAPVVEAGAQRIREAVARHNAAGNGVPLSISVGLAASDRLSPADLFRLADDSMYREKLHRSHSVRNSFVQAMMGALMARDSATRDHAERLMGIVHAFAAAVGLDPKQCDELALLAQFHDIGKVGVPDRILLRTGPLSAEETSEMRRHCETGHRLALSTTELAPIADWILKHHEWWNGRGYPLGLIGEAIPLECRIIAIADAFDAMTHDRPYHKAMTIEAALAELDQCAGTQFDPRLVAIFRELVAQHAI